jgi:hypothetical protein
MSDKARKKRDRAKAEADAKMCAHERFVMGHYIVEELDGAQDCNPYGDVQSTLSGAGIFISETEGCLALLWDASVIKHIYLGDIYPIPCEDA